LGLHRGAIMDPTASSAADKAVSWIDRQRNAFESDWHAGRNPRIEDILAGLPADAHGAAFRELLGIELKLRSSRGDELRRDEFRQRFPDFLAIIDEFKTSFARDPDATIPFNEQQTIPLNERDNGSCSATTSARYRDLRFFRRGGLGELYRAEDESLHRETVVKFINDDCKTDADLVSQFKIEAEVTSRLDHPGIVPVYGIGEDWNGRPFYVMRLIHGRELKQAIQEYHQSGGPTGGRKNRQQLFALLEHLVQACNTVAYAHHVGIVHCDLKPANIMIGKFGETFVLDWGLATNFERSAIRDSAREPTMRPHSAPGGSTSAQRGGTYGYISPEQLCGDRPIDPTSDVYSLGATLYEILIGRPPFNGRDTDVREQIRTGQFRTPRSVEPNICPKLEAICLKAMHLVPRSRYASAKQLASDVTNWMRDEETQASPDRWFNRLARFGRRHAGITAATFVTLLTIVVAAGWTGHEMALRALEEKSRLAEKMSLTTALDTFEDLCRPLANGEMSNLDVFRPFVGKIDHFTKSYLDNFESAESMWPHTGRVYELRALSEVYSGDTAQAVKDLKQAQLLYEKLSTDVTAKAENDLRLAHNFINQGRLFIQLGRYDEAINAFRPAMEILERLRKAKPESNELLRHLAEAYHGIGEAYLSRSPNDAARHRDLDNAESNFTKSKSLREQLVKVTDGEERRNHERDLARSFGYLGDLYLAQGKVARAAEAYKKSKDQRESLYRTNPRDPEHRFQFARGLGNFGGLELGYRGDLNSAIQQLEKARQIQQGLKDDYPEVGNFWIDLGATQSTLAELYLLAARDDSARADELHQRLRETVEQARDVYGRLSSQGNPDGKRGLAQNYVTLATLECNDNAAESQRLAHEAEGLLKSLGPEEMLSGRDLVTLAMALSLQGQPAAAFRVLHQAVQRGENTAQRFQRHEPLGFKAIADDSKLGPQLKALVNQVRDTLTFD
jgi:eukaryotic-like serine/threonine-protein kinase